MTKPLVQTSNENGAALDHTVAYQALVKALEGYDRLAVAFSGGVDSALLVDVAFEVLGDRMVAVTAAGVNFPAREIQSSRDFCQQRSIPQIIVDFHPLDVAGFRENPPDRCYFCKQVLLGDVIEAARAQGFETIADGSNADDLSDWRPGLRALAEAGIVSPLKDAGFTKALIRALARQRQLPQADKPAAACLASRIPYDRPIDMETLNRVEAAEDFLHDQGFAQVRVRVDGEGSRIEVPVSEIPRLEESAMFAAVDDQLRSLGFQTVTIDRRGYRRGSLNPDQSIRS